MEESSSWTPLTSFFTKETNREQEEFNTDMMSVPETNNIKNWHDKVQKEVDEIRCMFDSIAQMETEREITEALDSTELKIHSAKEMKRDLKMECLLLSDFKAQKHYLDRVSIFEDLLINQSKNLEYLRAKKEKEFGRASFKANETEDTRDDEGFGIQTQEDYLEYLLNETDHGEEIYDFTQDLLFDLENATVKESRDDDSGVMTEETQDVSLDAVFLGLNDLSAQRYVVVGKDIGGKSKSLTLHTSAMSIMKSSPTMVRMFWKKLKTSIHIERYITIIKRKQKLKRLASF